MSIFWMMACSPDPSAEGRWAGPQDWLPIEDEKQILSVADKRGLPGIKATGPDTGLPPEETGRQDTGAPPEPKDTGIEDTGTEDTGIDDTGTDDTGTDDTGAGQALDTAQDTGEAPELPPLVARLTVDVEEGEFPLEVSFDASDSELGTGTVRYEWSFGDGEEAIGQPSQAHIYRGRGEFEATLTLIDEATGMVSTAELIIDVDKPSCPNAAAPIAWGTIEDKLDSVSGIAASHRAPGLYWLEQDNDDDLVVVDSAGLTISEHDLPSTDDLEDIAVAIDPETGESMLFAADIGDNGRERPYVEIFIAPEPDPWADSDIDPLRMALIYPDEPHDAETLLIDPFTLDLYIVTKDTGGVVDQKVYRKSAPHDSEGPHVLDDLGAFDELDMKATGGDVSADGFRIIMRDYTTTARLFFRDAYQPFYEAFEDNPCSIEIVDDSHGEGATFTLDGRGIVTINEQEGAPLYYVEF